MRASLAGLCASAADRTSCTPEDNLVAGALPEEAVRVGFSRVDTADIVASGSVTLGYACPRGKCDFTSVLEDMERSIELRRWSVGRWCASVVRAIDAEQHSHGVAALDGIMLRRMDRDLVHLVNIDRPASGVSGLAEEAGRGPRLLM